MSMGPPPQDASPNLTPGTSPAAYRPEYAAGNYQPGYGFSPHDGAIKALAVCHFVWAGLALLLSCYSLVYIGLGATMMSNPNTFNPPSSSSVTYPMVPTTTATVAPGTVTTGTGVSTFTWSNGTLATTGRSGTGPTPSWIGGLLAGIGVGLFLLSITAGVLNLLSGLGMLKRKRRTLSLITAGLNCLSIPLGTVLGVFTFVILLKATVAAEYKARAGA